MRAFAELLDRLSLTSSRNAKLTMVRDYLRDTPDPDRGWALAALTGELSFDAAKPAFIRKAVEARMDPQLFWWSYDYVGDLAEAVSLVWPARPGANREPQLSEVIDGLSSATRAEAQGRIEAWLDALPQARERWALLKLVTGALRVGLSARLAKQATADLGGVPVAEVEELWHALRPPYEDLFAWLEGRSEKPSSENPARFRPVMLAQAIDEAVDFGKLDPDAYAAEWKWDGIRVQASHEGGVRRLYTRTGDDISRTFPDILDAMADEGVIDGELLVIRDGKVAPFADLQQRLNRKTVDAKLMASFPAAIRAYDLLQAGRPRRDCPTASTSTPRRSADPPAAGWPAARPARPRSRTAAPATGRCAGWPRGRRRLPGGRGVRRRAGRGCRPAPPAAGRRRGWRRGRRPSVSHRRSCG